MRFLYRSVVVFAIAGLMGGSTLDAPRSHADDLHTSSTLVERSAISAKFAPLSNGCDVDCYTPSTCPECHHKAPYVGEDMGEHWVDGGSHTWCFEGLCHVGWGEGGCEPKHSFCSQHEDENLEVLLRQLNAGDFYELEQTLRAGGPYSLDLDQGVVAVIACGARVAASVQLTSREQALLGLSSAP